MECVINLIWEDLLFRAACLWCLQDTEIGRVLVPFHPIPVLRQRRKNWFLALFDHRGLYDVLLATYCFKNILSPY